MKHIFLLCMILYSTDIFGATSGSCSYAGSTNCTRVFGGFQPYLISTGGNYDGPQYISTPICCKNWKTSGDSECSCDASDITNGASTTGRSVTCTTCGTGVELKFNGGTTSSGGTGGGTTTGTGVDCTTSNCNQVTLTDANGKLFCWTGQTGPCAGNTSNTVGMESCGLFYSKCYNGKGVTDSGGNAQWGPTACKSGYHKYLFDCYKDCSSGDYGTTTTCERCPEYYIDYVNESDKASGKYGRSYANANSVKECFMQAGNVSNDTFTNDIGTYSISSTCYYQ